MTDHTDDGRAWRSAANDRELVGTSSGLIALVVPARVDSFLTTHAGVLDGRDRLGDSGYALDRDGLLVATGGDGGFDFLAATTPSAVSELQMWFDEERTREPARAAGNLFCPDARLVLGDPGLLHHYTDDPFTKPLEPLGPWLMIQLPSPGIVAVTIYGPPGPFQDPIGFRLTWLPHQGPGHA